MTLNKKNDFILAWVNRFGYTSIVYPMCQTVGMHYHGFIESNLRSLFSKHVEDETYVLDITKEFIDAVYRNLKGSASGVKMSEFKERQAAIRRYAIYLKNRK